MSRWKILLVNDHSFNHSGTPRYLMDVVRTLDRSIFEPIVACPEPGPLTEELADQGIPFRIAPMTALHRETAFRFGLELAGHLRMLRREGIDLVHLNTVGWRDGLVLAAWLLGIPSVVHVHNPLVESVIQGNLNTRLVDRILLNADSAGGPYARDPHLARKFVTVYNGVDTRAYPASRSLRSELGIPEDSLVVGTVGQVCERKGIHDFLEMARQVLAQRPETRFLVVGRDAVGHEEYATRVKADVRRMGLEQRVQFTGHRADIPEVMRTLDVFVLASLVEPFGRVILEAMASALPVVASKVGGVPEIIRDPGLGVLVPPSDPAALTAAVLGLLEDPERRKRMGSAAREHVIHHFSLDRVTRDLEAVYLDLLSHPSGSNVRSALWSRSGHRTRAAADPAP